MIKFSIIIPVYNTGSYLAECLDSILMQTYSNFEIICINDASEDNSALILEDYAKKDCRIKVINNIENIGVGLSRNIAIKEASGEYIVFIDSDDFINENLLALCNEKIKNETEVVIFGAKTFNNKTKQTKCGQYTSKRFPKTFIKNKLFSFHSISYNKIYKKDFLIKNNIKFNNTKTGEDQIVFIKSMLLAKNVEIIKKDLYTYRKNRENSLTSSKIKNDLSPIDNFYIIYNFLKEHDFEQNLTRKIQSKYFLKAISWYGKSGADIKEAYLKKLLEIFELLKSDGRYWWSCFSIKNKSTYGDLKIEYLKSVLLYKMGF